jgi:DNA-binding transcriptional LysR family regulator
MLNAALAGFGLAYVPEDLAEPHVIAGRLKRVLEDWCPPFPGMPPLLPEPPPLLTGVFPAGRCAAGVSAPGQLQGIRASKSGPHVSTPSSELTYL